MQGHFPSWNRHNLSGNAMGHGRDNEQPKNNEKTKGRD